MSDVDSLVTPRTSDQRDRWFLWTFLAFVKTPRRANGPTALLLLREAWQKLPTLAPCCLLEAPAQGVLGGDVVVLGDLVAVLAGVNYVVAMVLNLLAALSVVVAVAGGCGGALLRAFQLVPVVVVVVQLRHLVDLDRGLWGMFDVDVDDTGAEHGTLAVAVGKRQRMCGVDLGLAVAT